MLNLTPCCMSKAVILTHLVLAYSHSNHIYWCPNRSFYYSQRFKMLVCRSYIIMCWMSFRTVTKDRLANRVTQFRFQLFALLKISWSALHSILSAWINLWSSFEWGGGESYRSWKLIAGRLSCLYVRPTDNDLSTLSSIWFWSRHLHAVCINAAET